MEEEHPTVVPPKLLDLPAWVRESSVYIDTQLAPSQEKGLVHLLEDLYEHKPVGWEELAMDALKGYFSDQMGPADGSAFPMLDLRKRLFQARCKPMVKKVEKDKYIHDYILHEGEKWSTVNSQNANDLIDELFGDLLATRARIMKQEEGKAPIVQPPGSDRIESYVGGMEDTFITDPALVGVTTVKELPKTDIGLKPSKTYEEQLEDQRRQRPTFTFQLPVPEDPTTPADLFFSPIITTEAEVEDAMQEDV